MYYANEGSDDVIDHSTKTVQHSIKNISGNIKAVFLNLAPEMYITKETKWQLSCHSHDNSYAPGPVWIKTKIPRFHLTQGSSTPDNLMGRVKVMWEPCLFPGRPRVPLKKVANGDIWFYTERDWNQGCCDGNNIAGVILFLLWCTFLVPSLKITALWRSLLQYFWRYS